MISVGSTLTNVPTGPNLLGSLSFSSNLPTGDLNDYSPTGGDPARSPFLIAIANYPIVSGVSRALYGNTRDYYVAGFQVFFDKRLAYFVEMGGYDPEKALTLVNGEWSAFLTYVRANYASVCEPSLKAYDPLIRGIQAALQSAIAIVLSNRQAEQALFEAAQAQEQADAAFERDYGTAFENRADYLRMLAETNPKVAENMLNSEWNDLLNAAGTNYEFTSGNLSERRRTLLDRLKGVFLAVGAVIAILIAKAAMTVSVPATVTPDPAPVETASEPNPDPVANDPSTAPDANSNPTSTTPDPAPVADTPAAAVAGTVGGTAVGLIGGLVTAGVGLYNAVTGNPEDKAQPVETSTGWEALSQSSKQWVMVGIAGLLFLVILAACRK